MITEQHNQHHHNLPRQSVLDEVELELVKHQLNPERMKLGLRSD